MVPHGQVNAVKGMYFLISEGIYFFTPFSSIITPQLLSLSFCSAYAIMLESKVPFAPDFEVWLLIVYVSDCIFMHLFD